jgi:curved DNA-binding protein CbpA
MVQPTEAPAEFNGPVEMQQADFVDYYEILEVSPSASPQTIERIFRELARRYHPDNLETGDRARFDSIVEANNTLKDADRRASYDAAHQVYVKPRPRPADEADAGARTSAGEDIGRDVAIQNKILSMLYVRRRTNIRAAGIGNEEMAERCGCSYENLEFHLWYLKEKGWIRKGEDGLFAITIEGVDRTNADYKEKSAQRLLADQS